MKEFIYISKQLWQGKSVLRAYLNLRLREETLRGKTIDIGGGSGNNYLPDVARSSNVVFENFDRKVGNNIDFENDTLPAPTSFYDTVLFLNVMEHIFNYQHIANEVVRITKPEGQLIGYVPFLMWYHPDHKDFFRYSHEALQIIFERAGAKNIKIESLAPGPFTASSHMFMLSLPRVLRPIIFVPFFLLDKVFVVLRPGRSNVFALGYFFTIKQ